MFRTLIARNVRLGARAFSTRSSVRPYRVGRTAFAVGGAALLMVPFGFISNDDQLKVEEAIKPTEDGQDKAAGNTDERPSLEGAATEETEPTAEDYEGAAYNPITGEINWDCPCLGGMAHGPCGEEFKEAFACFVYSETEPKGIDCIKKFEAMRTCFRRYPEHYKEQLFDDEDEAEEPTPAPSTSLATTSELVIETASVDTIPTEDATGAFDEPIEAQKHHQHKTEAVKVDAPETPEVPSEPSGSSATPAN